MKNLKSSNKLHIKVLLGLTEKNETTNTGQNISLLMKKYNSDSIDELMNMKHKIKNSRVYDLPENEMWKTNLIEELCLMKLNLVEATLEEDEIKSLLENLCTS